MKIWRHHRICRQWVVVLAVAVVFSGAAPVQCAESPAKVIRVGWYQVDGLNDVDESGNPSGFDYDYLKAIGQYTGWQYEFVKASWKDCLAMLENGQIDLLGGVARTEEREQTLAFSQVSQGVGGSRISSGLNLRGNTSWG